MRSQWVQTDRNSVLLDAYNANPSSMVLALRHFRSLNLPGKVLILGDMFELGADSRQEHDEILRLIGELGFDQVYLAGREFKALHGNLPFHFFETTEQLIEKLKQNPLSGNQILVKGSRGMKLERVLDYL
jgi:UDP-N-acetylmuramoyl-tripeptide--D-alanyl-D-alanine ligase